MAAKQETIRTFYRALYGAWGPQQWWPAESRFEVVVGAYLTQNTAWSNVEKALHNLRAAQVLSVAGIRDVPLPDLEQLVRPSGYFRQKAIRLKLFVAFLDRQYGGSLDRLFAQPTAALRLELLALPGVGPETADSMLLYAGGHEVFVVDAYTRRIVERHAILPFTADYEVIRSLFEKALRPLENVVLTRSPSPRSDLKGARHQPSGASRLQRSSLAQVYNEMHALIVGVGKDSCKKSQPQCDGCPLQQFLSVSK